MRSRVNKRVLTIGGLLALFGVVLGVAYYILTGGSLGGLGGSGAKKAATIAEALAPKPDDIGLGDPNAPIRMVEYASSGCVHCAHMAKETIPKVKENYIDKGLVYYVLRDFPLDGVAAAASLIARCLPRERFYPFMDLLFRNQPAWHSAEVADFRVALAALAGQAGLSPEAVESCLKDEAALARMQKGRDLAETILKVNSTPTSFINGEIVEGAAAYSEFDAKFKALLSAKP